MTSQIEVQLGKKGLTLEFLENLRRRFDSNKIKNIKISILKTARENGKNDVKKYAEEIAGFLGAKFTYKVLGFSIFLKKWRKARNKF